jgi:hypothetical protein
MATVLTRFITDAGSTVWMPRYDVVDPQDTSGYTTHTLPLSGGGVYDPDDTRPPRGLRKISRKGVLRETSKRGIQDAYDALAVAAGTKGKLYRQTETGDRSDWIPARLMVDIEDRTPQIVRQDDGHWVLATTITLELQDKVWHGVRHGTALIPLDGGYSLDAGIPLDDVADTTTLDTSPKTLTVVNDGNMPTDDVVLSLLAGSADVTAFTVQCGKAKWTWTGTLKAGNTLIIDTANALVAHQTVLTAPAAAGATTLTVANAAGTGWTAGGRLRIVLDDGTIVERAITALGGTTTVTISPGLPGAAASGREVLAAAYAGFARDATVHTIDTWLRLSPGSNTCTVTLTGGSTNSTLSRHYDDAWA